MATLVLTTVGRLVGGPIGGLLGALVGQGVDRAVLGPKGRQGPRLGELSVQTSSYGTALPKIFGTMRVAGTVIWASDLREQRHRGGGKGRARTTSYSYSASFAVALSARPVRSVGRVWADGNLLRGAAGDWKTEIGAFRLHDGGDDQSADPLIASAEGAGLAPAYRGLAYAVFEDLQLADYGNRIPSLSFEIEADAGAVSIGAIAGALSEGAVAGAELATLDGYAATGDSVIGALATLATVAPLSLADDGARLLLSAPTVPTATLSADEIGTASAGERASLRRETRAKPPPGEVSIAYYEPARDHQAGLQRARRSGAGAERIELPAALGAGAAKAIAERRLARAWAERTRRTVRLPFARAGLRPGQLVSFAGEPGSWRIVETTLERMMVELELVRHRGASATPAAAEPGRAIGAPDLVHGATVLSVFELPDLSDDASGRPSLRVAAAGASPGWRRAALSLSLDDGASWSDAGATAAPAVMGRSATALPDGARDAFDTLGAVEVVLLHADMALEDADDARLIAGANLALIGEELVQFGRAAPLGNARWRLSRLLRGRRGTEWAMATHGANERFVLIEPETLIALDVPTGAIGGTARVMASGLGDEAPVIADRAVTGASVRPPSPVRLRATAQAGGGTRLDWTRRSRAGWRWIDGVDAPLGEEREAYALTVRREGVAVREVELAQPLFEYDAAAIAADAGGATALTIEVRTIGSWAASLPARLTLTV